MQDQITQLKKQNELLKAQLMNSSLINELTKVMHSSTDLDGIIRTILLGIQEITEFDRIILFNIDKENFCLRPKIWVGIEDKSIKNLSIPMSFEGGEITDAIFLNRHFIVEKPDPELDCFYKILNSNTYLVFPLVSKVTKHCWELKDCKNQLCPARGAFNPYCWSIPGAGDSAENISENERRARCITCSNFKVEGVFWMDKHLKKTPISSDSITMLSAILYQAGIIIENFRMYNALELANSGLKEANDRLKVVNQDLREAQARINKDLEHARTIQQGLLPQNIKDTNDFSVGATYIPADAVGGDYYDVFNISPGTFGLVVADVSGHGVSSALIMSMAKVLLKTYATVDEGPQKTLERINETFLTEIRTDNFVTIFYGILDTTKNVLHYSSAGHCPVLFIDKKQKKSIQIKADGLFLGVFPDMMLHETTFKYEPGTYRLILYTDGLTEAKNPKDIMFDLKRLERAALKTLGEPSKIALEKIMETQKKFCGKKHIPADDITLLVIDI